MGQLPFDGLADSDQVLVRRFNGQEVIEYWVRGVDLKTFNNVDVQPELISGTNIKTINGSSVLGSGDLVVGGGISDGDKGDITVSASGATWTIDDETVTNAKMADMVTQTIKGRNTAGDGPPEDLSASTVKTILSLNNVTNTSDANKPVSTAQQTALDLKANLASPTFTGTVSGITKSMVGLSNVDNTSDANKPVSTAQQTALDAKQATLVSGTNIKTVNGTTLLGSGDLVISGGITDGDKGDITVGSGGAAWTIDNGVISNAKMADMATKTYKGRTAGTTGAPEDVPVATLKSDLSLNNVENTALSTWAGTTNITTVGTIGTGTWNATAIADGKIASALTSKTYNGVNLTTAGSATQYLNGAGNYVAVSGGDIVYAPTCADVAINNVADVTIATKDLSGIAAGDQIIMEGEFIILNNSTATRVYVITLDFDNAFDIEISTAALAFSSTLLHPFTFRAVCNVRSTSLAYAVVSVDSQLAAGIASGGDTTMAATHLSGKGWGETASNLTGTLTCNLKIRSANATVTQTCRLVNFIIRKTSPVG